MSKRQEAIKKKAARARGGLAAAVAERKEAEASPVKPRKAKAAAGDGKQTAKAYIEELCNGGQITKAEAVVLVVEKYGVTEKAAKGAVNNCRHYQHKEGRPQGEWKKAEKPEPVAA